MAFQTNIFRHGEWVTETVDLQAVLKANLDASAKPLRQRAAHPPECGILTRTVIESPVANWILPVRLRSAQNMDVAFIGDHYVQISELGEDGQLRDIIRKTDFGSRIRNAKVIGPPPDSTRDDNEVKSEGISVKIEGDAAFSDDEIDMAMSDAGVPLPPAVSPSRLARLPPQQLMIVLESGDCVFLFVRQGITGKYEFFDTRVDIPDSQIAQPGFHAAVDPSSRYMALACPENLFVVYELESKLELNRRYARDEPLRPIKSFRARMVNGVIHKMEFLYPHPDDDYHIILLLIIVMHGKSRMVTYEWEAGDDLASVLSEAKRGQSLPPQHQIPLLIIPLTVHSAFFAISARRIAVCRDALTLPAEFDDFVMDVHETSRFHHGPGEPLWAAWTRPYRLPTYRTTRDNIYLAREDGVVMFLEIDSDNILGASVQIGKFDCNIGTSFCSLLDDFNDILIMGGDSGPGSICQIRPRKPNIPLGTIPNWSPVVDFVTNDEFSAADRLVGEAGNKIIPWQDRPLGSFSNPDRIFATSGRGVTGAVTEFRFGYRANIGLDIDYETPVKQSWIFPTQPESADPEFHLLMSLVDRTVVLYLSSDLEQYREPDADLTQYDLSTRTVAATQVYEDAVVQVTEKYLVFVSPMTSVRRLHADIFQDSQVTVVDAFIQGNLVAVSTNVGVVFHLHILQLDASGTVKLVKSFGQMGEVTCLCLSTVEGSHYLVAGLLKDSHSSVVLYNVDAEDESALCAVNVNSAEITKLRRAGQDDAPPYPSLEPLTSVVLLKQSKSGPIAIVFGTRGGDMVTLTVGMTGSVLAVNSEKLGRTATYVASVEDSNLKTAILTVCDGRLSLMSDLDARRATFRSMHTVWLEDASDTSKESPFVSAVSVLQKSLPGHQSRTQLTLTAKTRVLLVELHTQPRPVHRSLPVIGTPLKVLYSCMLDCLIVALKTLDDKPTLQFLDPDTGEDLSFPTDKYNEPVEFVSGLGKTGDQILGLDEWQYERNGDKWLFLLVSTKGGRLLVLSTVPGAKDQDGRRQKIRYWTRYKRSTATDPIYSVVGWNNNVFYCMGSTLYWDQLDVEDRRLRTQGTFELASFATSLRILNGKIVALTERDSVEIISMTGENPGEMTLHHADSESRTAVHMIEVGDKTGDGSGASAVLLSNRSCGVAGLFIPWQQPGRDCAVIFEAELPASIRKLSRGRTRPVWQQARRDVRYGLLPSTLDGAEILGMCIDGSLQHFTLLSIPIWRILRLIQNLAFTTPTLYPFLYEMPGPDFDEEPEVDKSYGMQIDGDMLQRCLDKRALEELFSSAPRTNRLIELLEQLDNGRWTAAIGKSPEGREEGQETEVGLKDGEEASANEDADRRKKDEERKSSYLTLLYDILEYYLAPVL